MPSLKTIAELRQLVVAAQGAGRARARTGTIITIGMGTCGIAAGARETLQAFQGELKRLKLNAELASTGCIGVCVKEPLVDIQLPGLTRVLYANVGPEMVKTLVEEHLGG